MAAPTDVRAEATSISTVDIRWTYPGTADVSVHRSTDGVSYAEITTSLTRVLAGTVIYTDTGLTLGTKYWYKLSEDLGANFSSVVTVWTHSCAGPNSAGTSSVSLPTFLGDDGITADRLNEMKQRIETALNGVPIAPEECVACVDDGAVVVDCSDGCRNWTVIADEDINSLSINWCDKFDGTIDILVPPNVTVGVCGFPAGFGFSGDECKNAKISGGTNGRTMGVVFTGGGAGGGGAGGTAVTSKPGAAKPISKRAAESASGGGGSGGGGTSDRWPGGASCTCVARNGLLTVKPCNANNSLNCSSTKSLKLVACGGREPYTWSKSGSVTLSATSGKTITVTPPANTGSGTAGDAYRVGLWVRCTTGGGGTGNRMYTVSYGCNDAVTVACQGLSANSALYDSNGPCPGGTCCSFCGDGGAACTADHISATAERTVADCTGIACDQSGGTTCDARSVAMISADCSPCGLQAGGTVTCTDAMGVAVTSILRR
jgi:hypothetical protein